MLSPNSIRSKRTGRNLSICSIDSGYGFCLNRDTKLGLPVSGNHDSQLLAILTNNSQLEARDEGRGSISMQHWRRRSCSSKIESPTQLLTGDNTVIKSEEHDSVPSTPRLTLCTAFSNPSSPEPASPSSPCEVRRSHARRSASKLPSQAVKQLNAWLTINRHHPYPNAETKRALAETCSITIKQVTTWFTNIRQRQLKSHEDDADDIDNARGQTVLQTSRKGKKKDYSRSNGASPIEGFLSPPRLSPSASASENSSGESETWGCTFCGTPLTAKSWRRHEETQHHPKYQWTCLAHGPAIQLPSVSTTICAFCELKHPDNDHFLRHHRITECLGKAEHERTFGRPDHLQQHAKNFHKCERISDLVRDTWRKDGPGMFDNMSWTCGFCQDILPTWDARATHIASHFKAGATMAHWRTEQLSPSILPTEPTEPTGPATLDALANAGVTLAGPSNAVGTHINFAEPQSLQHFQVQSIPTTMVTPNACSIQDLGFDPFCFYGNPIDTFDPSVPTSTSFYPPISNMPAVSQSSEVSPMEYGVIGHDEFGNVVYDYTCMQSW